MVEISDKRLCVGCTACKSICPRNCISMRSDEEGFLYPCVDAQQCVDCGLCDSVCPVKTISDSHEPLVVLAGINEDKEVRLHSSSGGIFTKMCDVVIKEGGYVYGVAFDEGMNAVHKKADTLEQCQKFRGSKYVQSDLGNSFSEIKSLLNQGYLCLFTGTPCQISGLRNYLRKEYENLLLVDTACFGVPSPKVWNAYLMEMGKGEVPTNVNFRDKVTGWKSYSIRYFWKKKQRTILRVNDPYMCGYLDGLYTRPSCHSCPMKPYRNVSDITLSDFWGIENYCPELDDDKGVTAILINTDKGQLFLNKLSIKSDVYSFEQAASHNSALIESCKPSEKRGKFWSDANKYGLGKTVIKYGRELRPSWDIRLKMFIYNLLHR